MIHRFLVVLAILLIAGLALAESYSHTFDADEQGWSTQLVNRPTWSIGAGGSVTHAATGGNPGGQIMGMEFGSGSTFFRAPADIVESLQGIVDGYLSFDWFVEPVSGAIEMNPLGDVLLVAGATVLAYDLPNAGLAWSSNTVPLAFNTGWFHYEAGGIAPTSSEFDAVLQGLDMVLINGEFYSGDDVGHLDNVVIEAPVANEASTWGDLKLLYR